MPMALLPPAWRVKCAHRRVGRGVKYCIFATSTILGWALYGTRCAEFLFGSKIIRPHQVLFCLVVIARSVARIDLLTDAHQSNEVLCCEVRSVW